MSSFSREKQDRSRYASIMVEKDTAKVWQAAITKIKASGLCPGF
jgi:hypothetical protein